MKIVAIIPARYNSSRFPGKPLVDIHGKSMIQRVYEQARKNSMLAEIIIATDDERIMNHVRTFGASVFMTSKKHNSGTDRVAEVAKKLKNVDVVLNIQGDEPFIQPEQIKQLCFLFEDKNVRIASLVKKITQLDKIEDANVVKAELDEDGYAIIFSRDPKKIGKATESNVDYYKHLGIYGFRLKTLIELSKLDQGILEKEENLEQLRWMENGYKIKLGITEHESHSIDTPKDLQELLKNDYFLNK